ESAACRVRPTLRCALRRASAPTHARAQPAAPPPAPRVMADNRRATNWARACAAAPRAAQTRTPGPAIGREVSIVGPGFRSDRVRGFVAPFCLSRTSTYPRRNTGKGPALLRLRYFDWTPLPTARNHARWCFHAQPGVTQP